MIFRLYGENGYKIGGALSITSWFLQIEGCNHISCGQRNTSSHIIEREIFADDRVNLYLKSS